MHLDDENGSTDWVGNQDPTAIFSMLSSRSDRYQIRVNFLRAWLAALKRPESAIAFRPEDRLIDQADEQHSITEGFCRKLKYDAEQFVSKHSKSNGYKLEYVAISPTIENPTVSPVESSGAIAESIAHLIRKL